MSRTTIVNSIPLLAPAMKVNQIQASGPDLASQPIPSLNNNKSDPQAAKA